MSMYGALRLFVAGGRAAARQADGSTYEEFVPIEPGAWAAWARAQESREADERAGAVCVTADGRIGRPVRRFDGAHWVEECETA